MTSIAVAPIAVVKVKGEFVQKQHNIKKSLLKQIKNETKTKITWVFGELT